MILVISHMWGNKHLGFVRLCTEFRNACCENFWVGTLTFFGLSNFHISAIDNWHLHIVSSVISFCGLFHMIITSFQSGRQLTRHGAEAAFPSNRWIDNFQLNWNKNAGFFTFSCRKTFTKNAPHVEEWEKEKGRHIFWKPAKTRETIRGISMRRSTTAFSQKYKTEWGGRIG